MKQYGAGEMHYLVDLLGDEAVGVAGLAHEFEGAAAEAGHDGVALAAGIACTGITSARYATLPSGYPGLAHI